MTKKKTTRIIGIDYGLARIGIAFSDERKIIAFPYKTMPNTKKLDQSISNLIDTLIEHQEELSYSIEELVIGLPLMMNGSKGMMSDEVKHFAEQYSKKVSYPVKMWDERLTSVQAERSLRESSMSRKKRTKYIDTVSAVIILQSYLDNKSTPPIPNY